MIHFHRKRIGRYRLIGVWVIYCTRCRRVLEVQSEPDNLTTGQAPHSARIEGENE